MSCAECDQLREELHVTRANCQRFKDVFQQATDEGDRLRAEVDSAQFAQDQWAQAWEQTYAKAQALRDENNQLRAQLAALQASHKAGKCRDIVYAERDQLRAHLAAWLAWAEEGGSLVPPRALLARTRRALGDLPGETP
jgi:septal ring factor EnvC (AmiA/AmiB activator)